MERVQSKLSLISRIMNNKLPNSFEFDFTNHSRKSNFQAISYQPKKHTGELEFLIDASKLYCSVCPGLASRLICKIVNLTSEIEHTKTHHEFFSGKICPKCFSVFLLGINCKLSTKSITGRIRKKLKVKLIKLSKLNKDQFPKYTFKNVTISCNICGFNNNHYFWEKKRNKTERNTTVMVKDELETILEYSNYILNNTNSESQHRSPQVCNRKSSIKKKYNNSNQNLRFYEKAMEAGKATKEKCNSGILVEPKVNTIEGSNSNKNTERFNTSNKGNSFYDILSMLG
ncbi:RNAse P Rpr2/Rpp21 subunit [Cryptosporidium felis]|nr:RNAse P Rpr2/Rpp21 subunit [Cryptosporidium felis]